jgi:ParB family chromosome partitioning protein
MSRKQTVPAARSKLKNVGLFKEEVSPAPSLSHLPLEKITLSAAQPRRYFAPEAMKTLVASVQKEGILQPLLVRPLGDKYELVAGERRYQAAQAVGLTEVPVTIKQLTTEEALAIALTENLQREDLNPVEETEGILQLLALRLKTDTEVVVSRLNQMANQKRELTDNVVRNQEQQIIQEVFATISKLTPESFRVHRLPLLNLPPDILAALHEGKIAYTKAKAIAKVAEEEARKKLLAEAIESSLSLSQIRERVAALAPTQAEKEDLRSQFDATYKQLRKVKSLWSDPKKKRKLKSLLKQLEKLIESPEE